MGTYNVANACKGMRIKRAINYMDQVMEHKAIVGFTKHLAQRHAQCKDQGTNTGRWPEKSYKAVRLLLVNLKANCETKALDIEKAPQVAKAEKALPKLTKKLAARRLAVGGKQ